MAEIIRNLMYAVSFGCGLVGFLVICKQIASVREADRQKKAFYAGNPRAIVYPPPPHDWEAEARLLQVRVSDLEVDLVNLTHDLEDAKQGNADLVEQLDEAARDLDEAANDCAKQREGASSDAAEELGVALADAAEEADRHWRAGLNETERTEAWAEHWENFEQPVREAIEKQAKWWAATHLLASRRRADVEVKQT